MPDDLVIDPASGFNTVPSGVAAAPVERSYDLPDDETNPLVARLRKDPSLGEVSLGERTRLNAVESAYRGGIEGSSTLLDIKRTIDSPTTSPEGKADFQATYDRIATDLARYETMRSFDGTLEGAMSLAGQVGGGFTSPEALITRIPGVGKLLGSVLGRAAEGIFGRTLEAGVSQGIVQATTDPVVQAGAIGAGVQKEYDPVRGALAFPLGMAIGGALHTAGEGIGAGVRARADAKVPEPEKAALDAYIANRNREYAHESSRLSAAAEDPSMRASGDEAAIAARPTEPPPDPVDVKGNESATTPEAGQPPASSIPEAPRDPSAAPAPIAQGEARYVDRGGERFVARENGGTELGEITPEIGQAVGREPAPIRLPQGDDSFGEIHIEARHGAELRAAGYADAATFVAGVTDGFTEVYRARDNRLFLAKPNGGTKAAVVELRPTGEGADAHWTVTTAGLYRPEYFKGQELLWKRPGPDASPPRGGSSFDPGGQSEANVGSSAGGGKDQGDVRFRKRNTAPGGKPEAGTALAAPDHVTSLHEQALALADDLGLTLRQGRVGGGKEALGQFDVRQDVTRVKALPDFETVAHEAGHAIEKKLGPQITAVINHFAAELGPMDYEPLKARPGEGFAEWVRQYLTAPAAAEAAAPQFSAAFKNVMRQIAPDLLDKLDAAQASHAAWVNAPSGVKLDTIVKRQEPPGILERTFAGESFAESKEAAGGFWKGMVRTISLVVGRAYETMSDDKAPVTRAVRDLARSFRDASGGNRLKLEGADNPENLVRLFARAQQAGVRDMLDGVRPYRQIVPEGPSLRDALIKASGDPGIFGRWDDEKLKEFSNYLVARRAEVLWARYDAGTLPNRPLALTKADTAAAIADLEARMPSFRDGAQMVHDFTRQLLRKQYEGGLIERELWDDLQKESFYVPLYRVMTDKPLGAGKVTSGASKSDGPGKADLVKTIKGSDRDIVDPIQSIMTQAFLVNRTLAHNDIMLSFQNLARQAQAAGATGVGRIFEEVPAHQLVGKRFDLAETVRAAAQQNGIDGTDTKVLLGALTDTFGDDPIMGTIFRREPAGKRGEPIVFYKEGGQLRAGRLISKEEGIGLYEALAEMPAPMRDIAINIGSAAATTLRAGITTNPVFALTNFIRDQLAVTILRPDYVPFNLRGVTRELRQDSVAQLYNYAGGVSPGAGSAGLSEMIDQNIEALARKGWAVQKVAGIADLVTKGDIKAGAKAIGEVVEASEAGTRLNVMKQVFDQKKRQGLSDYDAMIEAASQATDVMDFGRHGSGTQQIRAIVPFINVHIQSLDKFRRTLIEPLWRAATGDLVTEADVASVKNAALGLTKMVGVGGALGYAYGLWASQHDAYKDANEEMRASHLIIPGGAFGFPGEILVIPKPFELAMGFNLGEMAALAIAGDPRAGHFALAGIQEVLMPPVLPTVVKTPMELALGRSLFTGRDIVPESLQRLTPGEQVIPGRTSTLAKQIGGALGVSPIKVDYAIGASFGMWGKDLLAASNATDPDLPAAALEDTMFARRFIKNADVGSETTKQFWKMAAQQNGQYAQAKTTYETMLGQFRDQDAARFLGALPAPERAFVTLNSAADERGKLKFTPDEKRLQPLVRAATAVQTVSSMVREMNVNAQREIDTGERVAMDPQKRRQVIDQLRVLSAMEQRNALVIMKEPGYADRPLFSTEDQLSTIRAIDAKTADEVATRYATAKVYPTATVARLWPDAQKRLLADGSQAEIRDLALDAQVDGWAFGGDRVKKAPKRRVPIPAQ